MSRFIETISIQHNQPLNLDYHQQRVNQTFEAYFPDSKVIDLQLVLNPIPFDLENLIKVRIIYEKTVLEVDYSPYQPLIHTGFQLVEANEINYAYKYFNRQIFNELKEKYTPNELIIIQNGQITDTSYSNLIFKRNNQWWTPETYLLNGTQRQFLLDSHLIKTTEISINNLSDFSHFKLINAMLNMENSLEYEIEKILYL